VPMNDEQRVKYMQQALRLAAKGAGAVAPNPMVGAVVVKDLGVIGKGFHRQFGCEHAEIEALNDCRKNGHDPRQGTMFVTLEPCCHHGKTPPCTEAIVRAGIAQVEIAVLDEFALVAGKGAKWLTEHGIAVRVGCCEQEARRLNAGFFKLHKQGQPQVILKWAQSLDGKLTWPKSAGRRWISNEQSRRHVHQLRSRCGAILVGVGTVLADDPLLTVRLRVSGRQVLRVVLDSHLKIPIESQLVQSAREVPVLICTLHQAVIAESEKVTVLRDLGCEIIPLAEYERRVDLEAVLNELGKRSVTDLLVEGGAAILKAFLRRNLADKVMVYIAPTIIGEGAGVVMLDFTARYEELQDVRVRRFGGDVLVEGYLQQF